MKLVYSGVCKENLKSGINISCSKNIQEKLIKGIFTKKSSDMLGFIDLPDISPVEILNYQNKGEEIAKKYKDFVVLGIGGSALGIKMLKNTFVDSLHKNVGIRVTVCDNIDSDSFVTFLDSLNLKKTMFNVITKSGSTSETLAQLMIVLTRLKRKKLKLKDHIIVTTTKGNTLYNWAEGENLHTYSIPESVGGRFSVLSSVGLLSAGVMGLDISGLMRGGKKALENAQLLNEQNLAFTSAYINYTYFKKGLTNLVTMPYSDRLGLVSEFFAQLWGESLGKKFNLKGEEVFTGQTPIKSLGVTDQHSQLQLYSEGIKDKLIMFMTVEKNSYDEMIEDNLALGSHLKGTTLKSLLDYEYNATSYSLTTLDRPNYTIVLEKICEETIGELIVFMEMMTAFMGGLLNVNAFDQPGVELSKIYTKACLKLKGYEKEGKNISNYKKLSQKFTL